MTGQKLFPGKAARADVIKMSDLPPQDDLAAVIRKLRDNPADPDLNEQYMRLYWAEMEKHDLLAKSDEEREEFDRLWKLTAERFADAENRQ